MRGALTMGCRQAIVTGVATLLAFVVWASAGAASPLLAPTEIAAIDLAKPFAARSAWRFSATQEAPIDDPILLDGEKVPGAVRLCLRKAPAAPCDPSVRNALGDEAASDLFSPPHYLDEARVVRGPSGQALLLIRTGSLLSGNGDQRVLTQVLAYRPQGDRFVRVYEHVTGHNNNQEVRYIASGLLKGDIVSAEPTNDAPYGFWMTVHAPGRDGVFAQVLRYRSATRYGDGNPLAVIDSETPNMAKRLGLWRAGAPMPLPPGGCASPRLVKGALWC